MMSSLNDGRTVAEVLLALLVRLVHRVEHGSERVAVGDGTVKNPLVECTLKQASVSDKSPEHEVCDPSRAER
jgi:hypothetical protein